MRKRHSEAQLNKILSDANISYWLGKGLRACDIVSLTGVHSNYVYPAIKRFKENK